jgi:type 1 glutamine amidotransferase
MRFHLLIHLTIVCLSLGTCSLQATPSKVLFVAGGPSHGPGVHAFHEGSSLLAEALNASDLGFQAEVSLGWPETIEGYDALVLYSDGLDAHVARGQVASLQTHVERGGGLAVIHFALEPHPGPLADFLLHTLGGRFEKEWSVNPIWEMQDPILAQHPVTRGVVPFSLKEEFYFHLRLKESITPLLRALPPLDAVGEDGPRSGNPFVRSALKAGTPQVLAWTYEGAGVRTFGYTGGHFHYHWADDRVRKLVLNAIAWCAGVPVPREGIPSTTPPIPLYSSIEEAIARGDLADVQKHIAAFPDRLHQGKNPKLSPLQQAILRKQEAIALYLIEAGAKPHQVDSSRRTLVHLVVERGTPHLIAALLNRGADPDQLDKVGWTPLHHAASTDKVEMARALLEGGADPTTLSERGGTPLHEAAASGGGAMIRLLLAYGVDPEHISKDGSTARDIALEYTNTAALEALP